MSETPNILRQAEELKGAVLDKSKNVSEVCVSRQKLEDLYKKVLLQDLEYALDRKVEQDLWNNCFKNQITSLQSQAKDRQNVKRTECQASLNLFLEMASGFYLQLIQSICDAFNMDLPFRRKSCIFGIIYEERRPEGDVKTPKKSSCLYICQYSLVHLGDIARYRQQVEQAETYYRHAAHLIPVNGQPYNQLAILEAARGNKLSTVFYYIRSLAVRCPFSVAATNLEKLYVKVTKENRSDYKDKLSYGDYVNAFLQLHGLVHLSTDLKKAASLSERLLTSLPTHLTNSLLTNHTLVQTTAITLYSLSHIRRHGNDDEKVVTATEMSEDERLGYDVLFKFIANLLETLLAYTPKTESKAKDFCTLPTIKILLDWLRLDLDHFDQQIIKSSTMWPHLAKLLNCLQGHKGDERLVEDPSKYDTDTALPEDIVLRGFQPLEKTQLRYSYNRSVTDALDSVQETKTRCRRLINYGTWLTQSQPNLLSIKDERNGKCVFTSPIPTVTFSADSPSPEKRGRQNVAMQAIMQNKHTSPDTTPSTSDTSLAESEGSSPDKNQTKYLLGTPMAGPETRKTGSTRTTNTAPLLFNSKVSIATKNSTDTSVSSAKDRKSTSLDDQPIQTSSQNPGLIQIATKDIELIEKSTTSSGKSAGGPKYYRNIAPRHRNKVPDSLQQAELERHMEEKPFCANKESWPALGTADSKRNAQMNAEGDRNPGNFQIPEPHQILHSLPLPGFPMANVQMPSAGVNIVRYPPQGAVKPAVMEASPDSVSHRYSRMNRGESHTASQDPHGDDFQVDYQTDYQMDAAHMEYSRRDVNNSNNLQPGAAVQLAAQMPNAAIMSSQSAIQQQQQSNNIQLTNMSQPFTIPPPLSYPQQAHMPYPDLRPQILATPFPRSFPIAPVLQAPPQQTIRPAPEPQPAYQQYPPVEFPRQLQNKPLTTMTQFMDGQRAGIFPSIGFMLRNPPPNVLPTSQPGGTHMRIYGMDGQTHVQNGDHIIASNPINNPTYGTIPLHRQTTQGEPDKPGTYSLFSGGPWSVQISSAGDSKSNLGSSPFLSNGGTGGSTLHQEPPLSNLPKPGVYHGAEWGPTVQEAAAGMVNNQNVPTGIQSLWNMPGPSPLQRLLEQQRQQRQTDPH